MSQNEDDLSSKTCIKATDTVNKKELEVSYMVSYRVARTGKPHTIVWGLPVLGLNSSCCRGYGWDNARGKGTKNLQTMTSSNNTVSQCISDMADVLKQLLLRIQASEFSALQLDESTDVKVLAQLLVYVRTFMGVN